jgi:hypothetical protein
MIILIDCDGVLLNWDVAFEDHMIERGNLIYNENAYSLEEKFGIHSQTAMDRCIEFNNSARMGFLTPVEGSVRAVTKLYHQGFTFKCISSFGKCPYARKLRISNLENTFGEVFDSFHFLDCGADKRSALQEHKGSQLFWIEDKSKNANEGIHQNLRSILLKTKYNTQDILEPSVIKCNNWTEITDYILSSRL